MLTEKTVRFLDFYLARILSSLKKEVLTRYIETKHVRLAAGGPHV